MGIRSGSQSSTVDNADAGRLYTIHPVHKNAATVPLTCNGTALRHNPNEHRCVNGPDTAWDSGNRRQLAQSGCPFFRNGQISLQTRPCPQSISRRATSTTGSPVADSNASRNALTAGDPTSRRNASSSSDGALNVGDPTASVVRLGWPRKGRAVRGSSAGAIPVTHFLSSFGMAIFAGAVGPRRATYTHISHPL